MGSLKRIIPFLIGVAAFGWTWERTKAPREARENIVITLQVRSDVSDDLELFYDSNGGGFRSELSVRSAIQPQIGMQEVAFVLPTLDSLYGLRIDPGDHAVTLRLHSARIDGPFRSLYWNAADLERLFTATHDMDSVFVEPVDRSLVINCTGTDPFLATASSLIGPTDATLSNVRPVLAPFVKAAVIGLAIGLLCALLLRVAPSKLGRPIWTSTWHWSTIVLIALCALVLFFIVRSLVDVVQIKERQQAIYIMGTFKHTDEAQVYYTPSLGQYNKNDYIPLHLEGNAGPQLLRFRFDPKTDIHYLRLDPGMAQDTIWLDSLQLVSGNATRTWPAAELKDRLVPNEHVTAMDLINGRLRVTINGNDPNFHIDEDLSAAFTSLFKKSGNGAWPSAMACIAVLFFLFGTGPSIARWTQRSEARTSDLFTVMIFLVVIITPITVVLTDTEPSLENTERRTLAIKPVFQMQRALEFPVEYTTYFKENFGLRKQLFRWNAYFYAKFLRTSPLPERTMFGKDGWMFYIRPGAIEKYQDICDIRDVDIERVAVRLEKRRQWLAAQGIHYVLMIPPEKSAIYGDKLPGRIRRTGAPSCLDKLIDRLKANSELDVVDIRATLKEARSIHEVYYRPDTHWNPVGAWYGYKALLDVLHHADTNITAPKAFSSYTIHVDENDEGDLARQIGLNDVFTRSTPLMISNDPMLATDAPAGSYASSGFFKYLPFSKEIKGSKRPRMLMFRDSFAVYMIPSLSEHFSRSTYVWTPIFLPYVVAEEQPDVIIHEVMELFLSDLLEDDLELPPLSALKDTL